MNAGKKSAIGTVTAAKGNRTRGKYTFVTRPLLVTRLVLESATPAAKNVHGKRAEKVKIWYGTPFDGKLPNFPKTRLKTTIVRNGWITAQATPIEVCL